MGAWVAMAGGVLLVLVVLADVYSTIFHYDSDGPVGHPLRRLLWSGLVRLAGRRPGRRRRVLGYAGPVLVGATFLFWMAGFIVGFALVVWPHLTVHYRHEPELTLGSFMDALYYSGITASVLGYGDITPTTATFKIAAFVESGLGFLLFSATVTYAITLLSGAANRNALGNRVRRMAGGRWDGVELVLRFLPAGPAQHASELEGLLTELGNVEEKLHHFPILDLYYRSEQKVHDPEPMLACLAEGALALRLVSTVEPGLVRLAEDFEGAVGDVLDLVAKSHLRRGELAAFHQAEAGPGDRRWVEDISLRLLASGRVSQDLRAGHPSPHLLALAARQRVFLDALDRITGWRLDHGPTAAR